MPKPELTVIEGEKLNERLTETWVVQYVNDEATETNAETQFHGDLQTDEQGLLWVMRGPKAIAVFNDNVWRQARRIRLVETVKEDGSKTYEQLDI